MTGVQTCALPISLVHTRTLLLDVVSSWRVSWRTARHLLRQWNSGVGVLRGAGSKADIIVDHHNLGIIIDRGHVVDVAAKLVDVAAKCRCGRDEMGGD